MRSALDRCSDIGGIRKRGEKVKFVLTITFLDLLLTSLGAYAFFGHCPNLTCLSTATGFMVLLVSKFSNRTRTYYNFDRNTLYLLLCRNLVLLWVYYFGLLLRALSGKQLRNYVDGS